MMTQAEIIATVAAVTQVRIDDLLARRGDRETCFARFLAVAAVRHARPHQTFQKSGLIFQRHHSHIIYAGRRHIDLLLTDSAYVALWQQVLSRITPTPNQP